MAGASDADNPVGINVVPMVDVIFCLCIFFMCSLKFTELEGKFKSWLPKDKGQSGSLSTVPSEIRFALFWDEANNKTLFKFGTRYIKDDELQPLIRDAKADFERINKPDVPVIVDGDPRVPWEDVLKVVNMAKRERVVNIEFAAGKKQ
ncbi:MAG: biopolymer transporter ExbD [Planctomycetota bacterium]|jgi:biopolymer transport protein ExbD|nr:biopolymer transporter ExbD [Planctomycetota bacterium]MSR37676.1 biopolymer transporter ExbD [Planctomycetota bacterium]